MLKEKLWHNKVKSVLTHPEGRAALKKFGIEIEAIDEQKEKETAQVVILVPTYRAPEPQMSDSLRAAVQHTRETGAIVYSGAPIQASVVHWSRNMLISEQIKSGKPWTHAIMIDDDMVIPTDGITKLLSHKKDIIAGLCTRRNDPPIPTIRHMDEEKETFEQIWEWPVDQTFEVGAVGTGFIMVTRHALEQVAQAYFDCLWEKDYYNVSGEWVTKQREKRTKYFDETKNAFWFRFLPAKHMAIELGEDMAFCLMAKKYCGLSIFCDSSVQPGHIGNYDYGIKDFAPYQKLCIDEAKKNGRYHQFTPQATEAPQPSFHITYEQPL
jgi:hypothetical protein